METHGPIWDPTNTVQCPQLTIQAASPQNLVWSLDARRKSTMGRWVNGTPGRIDLSETLELDCFTKETLPNGQIALKGQKDIAAIERMLMSIREAGLPGLNPLYWNV